MQSLQSITRHSMHPMPFPADLTIIGADPQLLRELRAPETPERTIRRPHQSSSAEHLTGKSSKFETTTDGPQTTDQSVHSQSTAIPSPAPIRMAFETPEQDLRHGVRYELTLPAICYPVSVSNEVDRAARITAIVGNVSSSGLMLVTDAAQPYPGLDLVVGVERNQGQFEFCAGTVVASKRNSRGLIEIHLQFGGYMNELLLSEMIFPVLDRTRMQFGLPFSERTLASLCKLGAMAAETLDVVLVCPHCQALPTLRDGCSLCLSSKVTTSKMIHHFACANVDFLGKFETPDGLCCQKCRTRNLIIGSDYEYLDGPQTCQDCGKSHLETIPIGHCLNCEHRFPLATAKRMEIVGYRVNRLDTLALIDSA